MIFNAKLTFTKSNLLDMHSDNVVHAALVLICAPVCKSFCSFLGVSYGDDHGTDTEKCQQERQRERRLFEYVFFGRFHVYLKS